jgi:hypothetical protein
MAQELLTLATANNPISASNPTATRSWTTDDGDFIPEENELGPLSNSRFGTVVITTRYDDEILRDNRPYNWKYSAGVQHEVLPRTALGVTYSGRPGTISGSRRTWRTRPPTTTRTRSRRR